MIRESNAPWTRAAALSLLLAPLVVAGCGELTAGGLAETEIVLSGDAQEPTGSSSHATNSTFFAAAPSNDIPQASAPTSRTRRPVGEVTATLEVSIQSPEGRWIPLTDGLKEGTVDIEGTVEAKLHTESLDPGLYPRIRVRFTDIRARVEDGLPVLGDIGVDFGDASSITVEKELNLDLADGDAVELLIDMNSPLWLTPALQVPKVPATHVRSAVDIRVR